MKESVHPEYQMVLFEDSSTGKKFLCGSTIKTKEKGTYKGKEYPVVRVPISSSSHPFFVGGKQIVDTEGRIDKFTKRYQTAQAKQAQAAATEQAKQEEAQKTKKKIRKA